MTFQKSVSTKFKAAASTKYDAIPPKMRTSILLRDSKSFNFKRFKRIRGEEENTYPFLTSPKEPLPIVFRDSKRASISAKGASAEAGTGAEVASKAPVVIAYLETRRRKGAARR